MIQSRSFIVLSLIASFAVIFIGCATANAAKFQAATPTPKPTRMPIYESQIKLSPAILAVMSEARYKPAQWGLLVSDLKTGETLYELNADKLFPPGSTAKLFSTAAALDALGADYKFTTPIYQRGAVSADSTLDGDLILVASGDLTMGGRTTPDDKIAITDADHGDANALPSVELTPEDPLAGLNDLARQVAASGIKKVDGNVIIDARLFNQIQINAGVVSPMVINENLIDVIVTPAQVSDTAKIEWRPQTELFQVKSEVLTVAAGQATNVEISSPKEGEIVVTGQIAADAKPVVRVYSVSDPVTFGRTLLIEALKRAGVSVTAAAVGVNPTDNLPTDYKDLKEIARIVSPPFSENIKLTNKVSQNYDANMMPMLVGMKNGKTDFYDGLALIAPFLKNAGVDLNGVALEDGEGGAPNDYISPRAEIELLRYMATRADAKAYKDSLPILGVDGSLKDSATPNSPAIGKVYAKTGTRAAYDPLNARLILQTKALAGYITAASGREIAFAIFVSPTPVGTIEDALAVGNDLGKISELIYQEN